MPDSVLFRVEQVTVPISEFDFPGPTRRKTACCQCGQIVRDAREMIQNGRPLCRRCAEGAYFSDPHEVVWEDMNWSPASGCHLNTQMRKSFSDPSGCSSHYCRDQVSGNDIKEMEHD